MAKGDSFDPPIFITVRDRVAALKKLVIWLEKAGHENIVFLDNDSAYEPCLEYLEETPHQVVRLGVNLGARSAWQIVDPDKPQGFKDWFIVTDPDVVPHEDCPYDAITVFRDLLKAYPVMPKAGFGLFLDDIPAWAPVLGHERQLMSQQVTPGVYDSAIDTTFALYRPGAQFDYRAFRTGFPYMARHDCRSWYCDRPFTDEDTFYLKRARTDANGSSWAGREVV